MWLAAQASGGLTKAGERLGVELLDVIRANAVLGYNVSGIAAPWLRQSDATRHRRTY